jgi:chromosome segregation ATPase
MERKEPTLNTGSENADNAELARRQVPQRNYDQREEPRNRPAAASRPVSNTSSSSSLPTIALVIALIAVAGAAFLGWQLFQAQQSLQQASDRIGVLEQQLNVNSQESNQSVLTLGTRLTKLADTQSKHAGLIETNRKSIAGNLEKLTAQAREVAAVKQSATEAKNAVTVLKQEIASNKSLVDASLAKVEPLITQLEQKVDTLNEDINKIELDMGNMDAIDRRLRTAEDTLKAIDDFRRTTNREILQLKQQSGAAPK